jgi:hypothetical protein
VWQASVQLRNADLRREAQRFSIGHPKSAMEKGGDAIYLTPPP